MQTIEYIINKLLRNHIYKIIVIHWISYQSFEQPGPGMLIIISKVIIINDDDSSDLVRYPSSLEPGTCGVRIHYALSARPQLCDIVVLKYFSMCI